MTKSLGVLCQYARLALFDLQLDDDEALAARVVMTHAANGRELRIGLKMALAALRPHAATAEKHGYEGTIREIEEYFESAVSP